MCKLTNYIVLVFISFILIGCGSAIKNYTVINKVENKELIASKGSTLFRVDKSSDLVNAFGKADIYGGKVDRGYTEVKLLDIIDNKLLKLSIIDINIISTETTMDRYGKKNTVNVSNTINSNNQGNIVEFDISKDKIIIINDIKLTVVKVTSFNLFYKLSKY